MFCGPFQLCHCLNVFPGTDLNDKIRVFTDHIPRLREKIPGATGNPFAAGVWFGADSLSHLIKTGRVHEFADFLRATGVYAFTANAFPYGVFHNTRVKTSVYTPDWSTQDRLDYTCAAADVLAQLLPAPEIEGSVSTLPGAYRTFPHEREVELADHLLKAGEHLLELREQTGKTVRLAVEMEPDCLWETPQAFAEFYDRWLRPEEPGQMIGVCYDTCHQELLGTEPGSGLDFLLEHRIPVPKIQLSAAISAPDAASKKILTESFQDQVYLHQTRAIADGRILRSWPDLPDALASGELKLPWKLHFHVPVFTEEIKGGLTAAKTELEAVLSRLKAKPELCGALEIETYSYNVLPDFSKSASLEDSMAHESLWVMEQLGIEQD